MTNYYDWSILYIPLNMKKWEIIGVKADQVFYELSMLKCPNNHLDCITNESCPLGKLIKLLDSFVVY